MDTETIDLAAIVAALDAPAMLALFIIGLMRGWWVMGDVARQRDKLFEIVLTTIDLLKDAAEELKESSKRGTPRGGR